MNGDEVNSVVDDSLVSEELDSEGLDLPTLPGSTLQTPPPTPARVEDHRRPSLEETLLSTLRREMNSGIDRYVNRRLYSCKLSNPSL